MPALRRTADHGKLRKRSRRNVLHGQKQATDRKHELTTPPYPEGIDCVWLASDDADRIGVFITGGSGPIPLQSLEASDVQLEFIEELVSNLPVVSSVKLLVSVPRPDSFIELASRGVFVFDWTDVHRTAKQSIGKYELVAVPDHAIDSACLKGSLGSVAKNIRMRTAKFSRDINIDVRSEFDCVSVVGG
jgi:hypothetical protein